MKRGTVTIAKYMVDGIPRYIRWDGDKMAGIFESAEEAKDNDQGKGPGGFSPGPA
jgi:hypothetical protein